MALKYLCIDREKKRNKEMVERRKEGREGRKEGRWEEERLGVESCDTLVALNSFKRKDKLAQINSLFTDYLGHQNMNISENMYLI